MDTGARASRPRTVHLVVPGSIDDPALCSGGNVYDRRLGQALAAGGCTVHERAVWGDWPYPALAARARLVTTLAAIPDGDTVLVDGLVACGVPDVVVPAARRLHVVVLVHLPLGDEIGAAPELVARERDTLHAAAGVVATSPWTARRLVALHGVAPDRIAVAAPGVDPAPLAPGPLAPGTDGAASDPALLCVGSITPTKGQDVLVAALAGLADRPWTCDLVGPVHRDPAHVAAVRAAVPARLAARVRLTGPKTGAALDAAYAAADLLVVPSRAETYGMVVTEALARGVPVLATDVGGLAETLGHDAEGRVPGFLVPADDPAALGRALQSWLDEPLRRNGLRESARRRRGMLSDWEVTSRCVITALELWSGTHG